MAKSPREIQADYRARQRDGDARRLSTYISLEAWAQLAMLANMHQKSKRHTLELILDQEFKRHLNGLDEDSAEYQRLIAEIK
jgi:hypothetical protein